MKLAQFCEGTKTQCVGKLNEEEKELKIREKIWIKLIIRSKRKHELGIQVQRKKCKLRE